MEISTYMVNTVHEYLALKYPDRTVQANETEGALTFEQFCTFLDLNGFVRTMFLRALNPHMWAIDPTGKPLPKQLLSKGTALKIQVETQR